MGQNIIFPALLLLCLAAMARQSVTLEVKGDDVTVLQARDYGLYAAKPFDLQSFTSNKKSNRVYV